MNNALIIVDVQVDFCEGGALAVEGGNLVAKRITTYVKNYQRDYNHILFTKDWHNPLPDTNGGHFSSTPDFKDSWPVHCVAGMPGAEFNDAILNAHLPYSGHHVFYKGQGRPDYSGFQGVNIHGNTLGEYLQAHKVETVDVVGIAGDYCVLQTALDAKRLDLEPVILTEMVASVGGTNATVQSVNTLNKA